VASGKRDLPDETHSLKEVVRQDEELEEEFHDAPGEFESEDPDEIDWDSDPLIGREASREPSTWTHSFFAKFVPRKPEEAPDDVALRKLMRDLLTEIEQRPPGSDDRETEERLAEWLQSVEEKLHPVEKFVAGKFGRHVAAWEELLSQSSRASSKSVLAWLRSGIKPSFAGTTGCEPKKLERVKRMLRRVVGESRVDEWLSGQVPHPVEFPNQRSFVTELGIWRRDSGGDARQLDCEALRRRREETEGR
jgi:hypothetical protein